MMEVDRGLWCWLAAFNASFLTPEVLAQASQLLGIVAAIYAIFHWAVARRARNAEIDKQRAEKRAAELRADYLAAKIDQMNKKICTCDKER